MLKETLLNLPEPILLVSHISPDADGISAVQATLEFLRWQGKECYTRTEGTVHENAKWMYGKEDFCTGPLGELVEVLGEAKSLVVFDCQPTAERLGFDPAEHGFEKIVTVDHHIAEIDLHDPENGVFILDVPSTGCVLINAEIYHPILYTGLWVDTVQFLVKSLEVSYWLLKLADGCIDVAEEKGEYFKLTEK